jgi:hypothetical protein
MRLAINLDNRRTYADPESTSPLTSLDVVRGDTYPVELLFFREGVAELLGDAPTITLGIKIAGRHEGEFLASNQVWTPSGSSYSGKLSLRTDQARAISTADSARCALEVSWIVDGDEQTSLAVPVTLHADYIKGDEGVPDDATPSFPAPHDIVTLSAHTGALVNPVGLPPTPDASGSPGDFHAAPDGLYLYTGNGSIHAWLFLAGATDF